MGNDNLFEGQQQESEPLEPYLCPVCKCPMSNLDYKPYCCYEHELVGLAVEGQAPKEQQEGQACCDCKDGVIYKSLKIKVSGVHVDDTEPLPQQCPCKCHALGEQQEGQARFYVNCVEGTEYMWDRNDDHYITLHQACGLLNRSPKGITINQSCEVKIITMYRRANELLAFMSAEGEISMRDGDYADNLSDSLFNLDGGTFKNKAETLAALQHTGEQSK